MKVIMGADQMGFDLKNAIKEDLVKCETELFDAAPVSSAG